MFKEIVNSFHNSFLSSVLIPCHNSTSFHSIHMFIVVMKGENAKKLFVIGMLFKKNILDDEKHLEKVKGGGLMDETLCVCPCHPFHHSIYILFIYMHINVVFAMGWRLLKKRQSGNCVLL